MANLTAVAYGPGYDGLAQVAARFAERLRRDPRVADVNIEAGRRGQPTGREVVRLGWGPEAVAQTSRSASEVAGLLRHRLETWGPSFYATLGGEPRVPVRLVTAGAQGEELSRLSRSRSARSTAVRCASTASPPWRSSAIRRPSNARTSSTGAASRSSTAGRRTWGGR